MERRFPASRKEMPSADVDSMAAQLGISPQMWVDDDFKGRSGARHPVTAMPPASAWALIMGPFTELKTDPAGLVYPVS